MRSLALLAAALLAAGCADRAPPDDSLLLRVGHFPNVTHAQGVIAHHRTRGGQGFIEERIGPGAKIDWYVFNAGPSAMEGLLSGDLDLAYVGPGPALNAYFKSKGAEVRIVSGAARGGSGLVVKKGSPLRTPADFRGKIVATPQPGNTQDIAARAWFVRGGLKVTQTGGDVDVRAIENPEQLQLFRTGGIEAAWTVEPWVSRLEIDAGGELLVEEKEAITTVLVASARAVTRRRALVSKFVAAHKELSAWIAANLKDAKAEVRAELLTETRTPMSEAVLDRCWPRLSLRDEISTADLEPHVENAKAAGFAKDAISLDRLVEKP